MRKHYLHPKHYFFCDMYNNVRVMDVRTWMSRDITAAGFTIAIESNTTNDKHQIKAKACEVLL